MLLSLWHYEYIRLKPFVDNIIEYRIRDEEYIEHIFDVLIEIPTNESLELMNKLTHYYKNTNPNVSDFYINMYKTFYYNEDENIRKGL